MLPDLEKKARDIEGWNLQSAQFQANPARTPADDEQLKSLDANLEQAQSAIRDSFDNTIIPELDKQSAAGQPLPTPRKAICKARSPNSGKT